MALLLVLLPSLAAVAEDEEIDLGSLASEDEATEADAESELSEEIDESLFDTVDQLEGGSGVRVATICTNCNAATLSVHGLSGKHVNVTWNGLPAVGGLATVYYLTQVPGDLVGYTGVVRGPGSVLTGDAAIGGSIDLHPVKRDKRRAYLEAQVGSYDWRQLRAAGTERWGPVGALVWVQGALENEVDVNDDTYNEVAKFDRVSYHGIFDFDVAENQTLTFDALFYGENQTDGPGGYLEHPPPGMYLDEDAFFSWRQFALQWERDSPSGRRYKAVARYSLRLHSQWTSPGPDLITGVLDPDDWTIEVQDENTLGKFQVESPVGAAGFITAGVSYSKLRNAIHQNARQLLPDQAQFFADGLEHGAAWIQYDRSVGAKWDYTLGLRYEDYNVFGKSATDTVIGPVVDLFVETIDKPSSFLSPRAQFHYRPNDSVIFGFQVGRGTIGPTPVTEATCCGATYQRSIDQEPERSWSYVGSAEFHPNPDMKIVVSGFWSDFTNYHERVVYDVDAYIPRWKHVDIPKARVRGLDLVHDMRFLDDLINVGWTYTYTDAESMSDVTDLDLAGTKHVVDPAGSRLRYVPEHAASAYFRFNHVGRGTKFSVDLSYTGSMRHFLLPQDTDHWHRWLFHDSEDFLLVDLSFEQRVGKEGWNIIAGANNVMDYYMPDLGMRDSAYDWGPIQGRFIFAGAKFVR